MLQLREDSAEFRYAQDFAHARVVVQYLLIRVPRRIEVPDSVLRSPHERSIAEDDPGAIMQICKRKPELLKVRGWFGCRGLT